MPKYTDTQLLQIARDLEPVLSPHGIHVAIGGSCVYRGHSDKDMDVMLYPHTKEPINRDKAVGLLQSQGWSYWRAVNSEHTMVPDVFVAQREGVRVDFFFLSR